ncbi:SDR family NAD(P)-dependent oxidoreductase [Rhizobium mesoamericanum]|uniref:Putative short-chain dehydrogenase n=1 Tax=Rhizobium mesoamericanum STM3625 TaxID=1211777 RepID=K0Q0J1_9HYPH|nr:SDR family NAD(P)-dependent oxidoreductase [Rhizobium mesoamericanum]CCM77462.1 putative short-chain dehydrogenase [Rhizobium mesoamericanum STM3625]
MTDEQGESLRPAVVVVGASRGIGRAIAKVAAREGATVVLVARSSDGLSAAANDVKAAGGQAFTFSLDLLATDASRRLQDFLTANSLVCDVLVNSAGYGLRGPATTLPIADQLGIVDVNVRALTDMTLHFLPGMVARGRGGVLNLGSIAGFTPGPNMALYYASKAFVRSFSEALHQEVKSTGVAVTCVAPGPVATEFLEKSGAGRAALFKILPKLSSDYVAERAWSGFKSSRRLVVPGLSAKLAAFVASSLPATVKVRLIGRLQRRSRDLCPCGSGKPFKECCGSRKARRGGI